ncbi:hypothetical protein, partial [Escherichia coli]|uniref:hypothetical protein n=1 Tax=Escherichia coli TaxID=562 RepID=UPI0015C31D4A
MGEEGGGEEKEGEGRGGGKEGEGKGREGRRKGREEEGEKEEEEGRGERSRGGGVGEGYKRQRKCLDGKEVIPQLDLTINNGEFLTLLGPSG